MRRLLRNMRLLIALAAAGLLLAGCWNLLPPLQSSAPRLGLLGDSGTDEYQGSDQRGGSYHAVTFNWLEHLVESGRLDAGKWGDWGEPRRTGYEYNWARSGATARTLIESGQHTGLAAQVAAGKIDVVFISIGSNDFAPYRQAYELIYTGELAGDALKQKNDDIVADVALAVDTLGSRVPVVLTTIVDWNLSPSVMTDPRFPDAARRRRVSDAIAAVNAGLLAAAESRDNVTVAEYALLQLRMLPELLDGRFDVGGVNISFLGIGDEPHNAILGDNIHVGTVMEGVAANFYLEFINQALGTAIPPLTDAEILRRAGL